MRFFPVLAIFALLVVAIVSAAPQASSESDAVANQTSSVSATPINTSLSPTQTCLAACKYPVLIREGS